MLPSEKFTRKYKIDLIYLYVLYPTMIVEASICHNIPYLEACQMQMQNVSWYMYRISFIFYWLVRIVDSGK